MRILRKFAAVILVVALVVMLVPASVFAAEEKVVIFHTNDIHGRAEGNEGSVIGYARYKEIIDAEKALLSDDQVLVFDCGDVTHGTNFATLNKGESMIDLMNMVGVDAMASGNHEFNYGPERLKELEAMADFPIMAANVTKADGTGFFAQNSKIFEVSPEIKIGIFGLATPETRVKSSPKHTAGLDFGAGAKDNDLAALAQVAQAEIDALAAAGANFIIMMGHLGVDLESVIRTDHLIPLLKGLDLAIDGHSHTVIESGREIADKDAKPVLMVQTGYHFANVGKVTLTFDGADLKDKKATLLGMDDVGALEGDPAVLAKIEAFNDANKVILEEVIGETAVVLDGEREQVRAGETNLGNLVVDSIWKASGADVALSNGGNVRRSVPVGPITMGVALEVLPFENTVVVIKVTGQDIIDALTHGSKAYPGTAGGFPHVAGMSFTIVTTGEGEDETFVRVEDVKVGGQPIDPAAYYSLATNDFLAIGGDGYDMFAGAEELASLGLMLDFFADEIRELSKDGPFTVKADGRLSFKNIELVKKLVIFHTNDIHGRAEGDDAKVIGYARYKEIIEAEKLVADEVLVLDAGDAVHGTLFAQFSKGASIIDLMNAVGVDAMACGNHEFDYGADQLKVLEGMADFPIMGANVKGAAGGFFEQNHMTFNVGGKKIVVFGIATPETKVKAHPNYTKGLSFGAGETEEDLAEFAKTVQAVIDELRDEADFLIMMGHLGVDKSSTIRTTTLLPLLTGLDMVIDGHSHTVYGDKVKDKDQKDVQVVQTGSYFANIGKVTLSVGKEVTIDTAEVLPLEGFLEVEGDAEILALIQQFNEANEAELSKPIGKTAVLLEQFGEFRGADVALVRVRETNLGNLVADSLRKATGADVAMTNGGGIRANIEAGVITFGDANTVLPFGNLITVIRVTGQQIVDALAHGAGKYPAPNGGFPQVSGLSYVIVTEGVGEEETFVKIANVLVDGEPIDPAKYYTLATNDFMAVGGDGYDMFEGAEQVLLHGLMLEAFIEEIVELTKAAGGMDGPGFSYEAGDRILVLSLEELEPVVPTGETMTYVAAGVFFLATAGLFLALSRKKAEDR